MNRDHAAQARDADVRARLEQLLETASNAGAPAEWLDATADTLNRLLLELQVLRANGLDPRRQRLAAESRRLRALIRSYEACGYGLRESRALARARLGLTRSSFRRRLTFHDFADNSIDKIAAIQANGGRCDAKAISR